MNPKISIIISTYNRPKYLRQAIGSIIAQTFEDWECLVVIDKSTGAANVVPVRDDRFWVFGTDLPDHSTDRSPGIDEQGRNRYCHNINLAFKHSKGDYVTYLCDDDLYLPYRLEFMGRYLDQTPQAMMVYGKQSLLIEDENGSCGLDGIRWSGSFVENGCGYIDHSSVMHRRECFEKADGWDESAPARYGDMYFWKRLHEAGYVFHGIPEVLDIHRFSPDSTTTKADKFEAERKELQIK